MMWRARLVRHAVSEIQPALRSTIEIDASLRVRQGPRLDQQTLSLVAAAGPC